MINSVKCPDYRLPAKVGRHYFCCDLPGISGTTSVFVKEILTDREDFSVKYIARVGVAIMGAVNDPDCFNKCPFDEDWMDNYVEAKAYTKKMLWKKLQEKMKKLQDSLWD